MTEAKEYSSLPLVLAASGAILFCAATGWFLLGQFTADAYIPDGDEISPLLANTAAPATAIGGPLVDWQFVDGWSGDTIPIDPFDDAILPPPVMAIHEPTIETIAIDVESELRKARLAADADLLVSPLEQNALYFYGRIVAAEPDHATASAEFDAVLARISLIVFDHLSMGEFDDAYNLAAMVARRKPEHALVGAMRNSLNERAERLLASAIQHAQDGNAADAADALANAEALPGFDAASIVATRDSIVEIQQSLIDAELDRLETERLAAEQDVVEWTGKIRGAIKSGRLVSPMGDNARDYLAERDSPMEAKEQLTGELLAALMTAGQQSIETGDIDEAEAYINAASDLRADTEGLADVRDTLESKIIEAEEARVLGLKDFVRLRTIPARYPRIANQRNITGWVDVRFTVTPTGETADIEVVQAEPESIFDDSAIEAVEQWTFQPRQYRGQLLSQRTQARLVFRLE